MIFLYMLIADVSLLAHRRRRRRFEFSLQHFLNFHAQKEILSLESDSLKNIEKKTFEYVSKTYLTSCTIF